MNWWSEFANQIRRDVPLGPLTWFRLGGCSRFFFYPHSIEELARGLARAREEDVPVKVLGCGANVLIRDDGFDGMVVRLSHDEFKKQNWRRSSVSVGGGVDLMPFSRMCGDRGLSGMECMAGIPATMGGAICMNAGGPAGELGRVVRRIHLVSPEGEIETWSHDRIRFGYRRCELDGRIVVAVDLQLEQDDPRRLRKAYDEQFERKQKTQPLSQRSAGCIFKNPPHASAGALIDQAGLKGQRHGAAMVSHRHANFIVAQQGATTADVRRLIDKVRERVRDYFGVSLETEIDIW